ncbi:MAG: type IV pilus assembly protein PilO [Parasphingorhabdus sp.]|jgi:type IV pilus assembly protein PilO
MAIDFSELQDIDISDLSTWPQWFKVAMTFVVFFALIYAGYHFIVSAQLKELRQLEQQEKSLRQVFLDRKAKAINLPLYRQQLEEIERNFAIMVDQLPDKTEVPQLLIDITQAGLSRGLEFLRFKPNNTREGDFYETLPINLTVRGTYHQMGNFVSDLAALPRIVTMGNVIINGEPSGILNVRAVIRTYRYQDEFEIRGGDSDARVRKVRD